MENFKRNLVKETLSAPSMLEKVRLWLKENVGKSILSFAKGVCQKCGFVDDNGKPQTQTCVSALRQLDKQGLISLQENLKYTPGEKRSCRPVCLPEGIPPVSQVPERVDFLTDLHLEKVDTDDKRKILNTLLEEEHYLGAKLPPGYRISYLICSEHGFLGAICFSSAANRLKPRDSWIGWSDTLRKQKLDCILNMSRFLIRKDVHCQNLATKAIRLSLEAVQKDCLAQYHFSPYLIETFVDPEKFEGTCYKAAGWELLGETQGRGWNDRYNRNHLSKKLIFVATLVPDFRKRLGIEENASTPEWAQKEPLQITDNIDAESWARLEFAASDLGHQDRNERLIYSASVISLHPHDSATLAFGSDTAGWRGWYRFIETTHEKVSFDSILSGPTECTCRRMMGQNVVLLVQDDTKLNFTSKPQIVGLGSIGSNQTQAATRGLILHTTMAFTPEGLPLGILKATCFARPESQESKVRTAEEKESYLWIDHAKASNDVGQYMPNTKLIHVCDRGADIALFLYECAAMEHCDCLVRAKSNRVIPGDIPTHLFSVMESGEPKGTIRISVARKSERPKLSGKPAITKREAREAVLNVRFHKVTLSPPPEKKGQPPIEVYTVSAIESDPPEGQDQIVWRFLTTLPVKSFEDAVQCVQYYTKRWGIEEFHRVLKTGCNVENLAHKDVTRLKRALAVYIVVACRIMTLLKLGREFPDLPVDAVFDDVEMQVLEELSEGKKKRPLTNLYNAIIIIARLGGYLDRNNDPPPGYEVFWKGYEFFQSMCQFERQRRRKEVLSKHPPDLQSKVA